MSSPFSMEYILVFSDVFEFLRLGESARRHTAQSVCSCSVHACIPFFPEGIVCSHWRYEVSGVSSIPSFLIAENQEDL